VQNAFVNYVVVPADESQCTNCGQGFNFSVGLSSIIPNVGDTYGLQVTYSDGTSETFTPTVGAVLNAFAANLAPITEAELARHLR